MFLFALLVSLFENGASSLFWKSEKEKIDLLKTFCKEHKIICILKGAHTTVSSTQGTLHFNSSGNPGMATAGSGDVLTGIIGTLLAQGYKSLDAAILGVYLHGAAGDHLIKVFHPRTFWPVCYPNSCHWLSTN